MTSRSGMRRGSRASPKNSHLEITYLIWGADAVCRWPGELSRRSIAVTGVDISEIQIARARELVPNATFIVADASAVNFAPASFDAVSTLYALITSLMTIQRLVIDRIGQRLKPGGLFLATVGHTAWTGEQPTG
jgi:SAM-dependent methyltransferase